MVGLTFVYVFQDKEVANGGVAPRMLCLDDYFMVEAEKSETDPETGKVVKKVVCIFACSYYPALVQSAEPWFYDAYSTP